MPEANVRLRWTVIDPWRFAKVQTTLDGQCVELHVERRGLGFFWGIAYSREWFDKGFVRTDDLAVAMTVAEERFGILETAARLGAPVGDQLAAIRRARWEPA